LTDSSGIRRLAEVTQGGFRRWFVADAARKSRRWTIFVETAA
jgi:hypothetical protein